MLANLQNGIALATGSGVKGLQEGLYMLLHQKLLFFEDANYELSDGNIEKHWEGIKLYICSEYNATPYNVCILLSKYLLHN